jgi:16S rRNA processing protein RimM
MPKSQFLECGKIVNTHGVRGGLKLESWCDTPQDLASLKKVFLENGGEYQCFTRLQKHRYDKF